MASGQTQVSAFISESTKDALEQYAEAHGLKKAFLIEEALLHHPQALRELPLDVVIPARLVVSRDSGQAMLERVTNPRRPTSSSTSSMAIAVRKRNSGAFLAILSPSFGSRVWLWTRRHKGAGSDSPFSRQSSSWSGQWPATSAVSASSWTPSRKRLPSTSGTDSPLWKWLRDTSGTDPNHFRCFLRSGRFPLSSPYFTHTVLMFTNSRIPTSDCPK